MISAKQLLKITFAAYYKRQGVGRKRMEKLLKADLCAYVRNVACYYGVPESRVRIAMSGWAMTGDNYQDVSASATMFPWYRSPEGHTYWANRFGFF